MKSLAVCFLLALLALPAAGLEPYLVKDVHAVRESAGSIPHSFVTLGGTAIFSALTAETGFELWASDGTAAGTGLLADLVPGESSGFPEPFAVTPLRYFFTVQESPEIPRTLWVTYGPGVRGGTVRLTPPGVAVDGGAVWSPTQGALYFAATDELHGRELWRSDGTSGGTYLVADLLPGRDGSWPTGLQPFKGRVWFGAVSREEASGSLWRTDGNGTTRFLEFGASIPTPVETVGGRLLFVTTDRYGAQDLWSTDGTARKTAPILRLRHSRSPGKLYAFARYGPRVFFVAEDSRWGQELWVTDGTPAGTRRLTSIAFREPFYDGSSYLSYAPALVDGRLVFTVRDGERVELWATDGTPRGTGRVWSCPGDCPKVVALWPAGGGLVYWLGEDADRGRELWATDGTSAGTGLVLDLCPGACTSDPADPFVVGDRLLFTADDGTRGRELWSTDGTPAGTVRVSDFEPDEPRGPALGIQGTVVGERLLFGADEGLHGAELWTADGTPEGTALVQDLNLFEAGGSYPEMLGALGDKAFFFGDDGVHGFELWKSDGTEPGTSLVAELVPGEAPYGPPARPPVAELGGALFFVQYRTPNDAWLMRTDGTAAGTVRITPEGVSLCCAAELAVSGGRLFFMAGEAEHGFELWATDGTAAGTGLVADLRPGGLLGALPQDLTAFEGDLYFMAQEEDGSRWLWRSDGTEAGTVRVADLGVFHSAASSLLTVHAGRLWFAASDGGNGLAIWRSDGTPAGTGPAVDVAAGSQDFTPNLLVSLGDKLAFSGLGEGEFEGLWVTDGTPEGTERIAPAWSPGTAWTVFQGRLFYTPVFHFEPLFQLVVTDGTEEGTRDLGFPGAGFEPATSFAPLGDRLLFSTAGGRRLWETDGTEVFPVIADWFQPFEGAALLAAGPRVFLRGYSPATGVELWAVQEDAP